VYGLCAIGLVAHMVFLVDYVARGLGQGIDAGAALWVAFGAGALFGPMASGRLADAVGFKTALRLALATQAIAVVLAVAGDATWLLYASSILVGAAVPGIVPLVVGRAQQLSDGDSALQRTAWSYATVAFSIGQAVAAYAFSYMFETTGRYDVLFQIGAAAALTALIIDLLTPKSVHR
jgi:predicted MFS family arabinose efflux permease